MRRLPRIGPGGEAGKGGGRVNAVAVWTVTMPDKSKIKFTSTVGALGALVKPLIAVAKAQGGKLKLRAHCPAEWERIRENAVF